MGYSYSKRAAGGLAALSVLLLLGSCGMARAQAAQLYWQCRAPSAGVEAGWCPVSSANPAPVSATTSIAGFTQTAGATANLSNLVNVSQDVALPAGSDVVITNKGSVTINFRTQVGAGTAVSTDQALVAGAAVGLHITTATHLSAIAPTGTGTGVTAGQLNIQGGSGLATGYGGGSSTGTGTNVGILDTTDTQIDPATTATDTNTAATATSTASIATNTASAASSLSTLAGAINNPIPAGTASIGGVTLRPSSTNGATSYGLQSAASTNSTSVKGSAGTVYGLNLLNTTTTIYYLRMYDASSAPTCSSATNFTRTWPVPPAAASGGAGGIAAALPVMGVAFSNGIAFCLTGGPTSTDNTNAATGVFVNIDYN